MIAWLLAVFACACALGWVCGVRNCDVGFFAAVAIALLVVPGEGRAR